MGSSGTRIDPVSSTTRPITRKSEPDADALAQRLAHDVAGVLGRAIDERGTASLVVSGGGTPKPMFQVLATHDELDWSKVTVTLADERAVPVDHADSNERFVHEHLLVGAAAKARFVSLLPQDVSNLADLGPVAARVDAIGDRFDVVMLGMGGDGHTASLFPDAPELESAMDSSVSVVAVRPPSVAQARISLSGQRLVATRHLWLHISGDSKRDVLESALAEGQLPIARVFALADSANVERLIYLTS